MSRRIALIRAGALHPIIGWMSAERLPVERLLDRGGLAWFPWEEPGRAIPLHAAARFLAAAARSERTPDIGARIGRSAGAFEMLGPIARETYAAPTARAALEAVAAFLPCWSNAERASVEVRPDGVTFVHWLDIDDPEALHHAQQYVAALILGLVAARPVATKPAAVSIPPPPGGDLAPLRPLLGASLAPSRDGALRIRFAPGALDVAPARARRAEDEPEPARLGPLADMSFAEIVSALIAVMLEGAADSDAPSLRHAADATGISARSLQRGLAEAGTSYSTLLDAQRREQAIRALKTTGVPIGVIAHALGYRVQSSMTRAARRWTKTTPRGLRRGAE